VAEGTGILLNNEMDDFTMKPGVPNLYGLVQGEANAIEPGKSPLSSMSPTIVSKDGKPFMVIGSPGGSRIITITLEAIMNVVDHGMDLQEAIDAPRIHHQWSPDEVLVERGFSPALVRALGERGHKVTERGPGTSASSILVTPQSLIGAADNRTRGALAAGY
jgi:gamma-glutamyltranspeptidase/glutathione hydrolase